MNHAGVILAESSDTGFHAPSISEFFPPAIWFEGTPFEINRITLVRLVLMVGLMLWLWLSTRHAKLVPTRAQSVVEVILNFIKVEIAESVLGKENGRKYLTLLVTLFFSILAMNIGGVIPFLNIAGTAVVGLPLIFALVAYIAYLAAGIRKKGLWGFIKGSLFPPGVPLVLYVLLTPIEFLQVFILRPLTLALRLLANMMAGHLMLVLCFAATQFLLFSAGGLVKGAGVLTLVAGVGVTVFEIFVAALQAFIFTLLTAVYIQLSLEDEH